MKRITFLQSLAGLFAGATVLDALGGSIDQPEILTHDGTTELEWDEKYCIGDWIITRDGIRCIISDIDLSGYWIIPLLRNDDIGNGPGSSKRVSQLYLDSECCVMGQVFIEGSRPCYTPDWVHY